MFVLKVHKQFLLGMPACVDCSVRAVVCKGCAVLCELIWGTHADCGGHHRAISVEISAVCSL